MNHLKLQIKGFKSIINEQFEPGQVNVLIGANGSGKTALLEAIGMLSAAMAGKVDDESLQRRGVRLGTPSLYKSAFKGTDTQEINLAVGWEDDGGDWNYSVKLENNEENLDSRWYYEEENLIKPLETKHWGGRTDRGYANFIVHRTRETISVWEAFESYAIYTPTTPALRDLITDVKPLTTAFPLGLSGNRLADAMEDLLTEDNEKYGHLDLDEVLDLLDWIDNLAVGTPDSRILSPNVPRLQKVIRFTDRFMREHNNELTAYDASEGSLYVLFLLTVAMHSHAPRLFAIENFDQAMHPRLARQATRLCCEAMFANPRQPTAFLTTHNPLVLDGLNLLDERIRLFAIDRNSQGYTTIHRVTITEELLAKGNEGMTLSRLWVMGLLGGVPNL